MTEQDNFHDGGCMCGALRYRLHGRFSFSAHCHCRSCQRAVGAGTVTYTGVPPEKFEMLHGEQSIFLSSPGVRRGFCNRCGTSISYAGDNWADYAIMTATLDDPNAAKPTSNIYLADRLPWVAIDDSLKQFEHFP